MAKENDLTICFYTANVTPYGFTAHIIEQLMTVARDIPIISVSKKPMELGTNIVVDSPRTHVNIYRQALIGAKEAKTKYIALCEDDVLYSPTHFDYRPSPGKFAYNSGHWNIYTWGDPIFSWKGRRNLGQLICERDLFIEAMEERFAKYPDESMVNKDLWAEPSKYERQLGVTVRESETFFSYPPNIVFSHETELSYLGLGKRKRIGDLRATEIPYWGTAKEVREIYAYV